MFETAMRLFLYNLLLGVGLALRFVFGVASLRSGSFRNNLRKKAFTILIKTGDLKIARHYRLEDGKFKSKAADYQDPDLSITWSDCKSFARTFFKVNPIAIVRDFAGALSSGSVAMTVDMEATGEFAAALGEMMGVYRNFFHL